MESQKANPFPLHFWKSKHRDHTYPQSPGPETKPGPTVPGRGEVQGWKRQEALPGVRKGLRGSGTTRRRGLLGSAPPHQPGLVFLTSFASNSEQAEHGTSSSGSFPATLLPKQHLSRGSKWIRREDLGGLKPTSKVRGREVWLVP